MAFDPELVQDEISRARTFGFLDEVDACAPPAWRAAARWTTPS